MRTKLRSKCNGSKIFNRDLITPLGYLVYVFQVFNVCLVDVR